MTAKNDEIKNRLSNERKARKELYKSPVLSALFLEVTSRCNARCEHCGSRCDGNMQGEEISAEDLKRTLKEISLCYNPKKVRLWVTGGEPLIRKDLFDIIDYANSLGFYWGMTSNGMLIDEKMVKKLEDNHLKTVSISIDGLKETHEKFRKVPNCYEKILKGIELMQQSKEIQVVEVTTVVTKKNIDELEALYQLLLDYNVKYWRVINCEPIGRANDNKEILLDGKDYIRLFRFIEEKKNEGKMKDITYGCAHYLGPKMEGTNRIRHQDFLCLTGLAIASILSNGDIFVCPNVPRRKELIQGNIKTDSFVNVWETKYQPFRSDDRTSNDTCKKCKHWEFCQGDSFHSWDFDENKPSMCLKEIYEEL
ncbi:MAG: radical SAM protein [Bacilli bacterium]|nr:radical SAM protein [Bacilli bacterium]